MHTSLQGKKAWLPGGRGCAGRVGGRDGVMDMLIILIVVMVIWCVHRLKLTKSYALYMCSLLYANYT